MNVTEVAGLDADMLVAYILDHHATERFQLRVLAERVRQLAVSHAAKYPKLHEVARRFEALGMRMRDQMTLEERQLFPYVTDAAVAFRGGHRLPRSPYRSIEDPIARMAGEHAWALETMSRIRALTSGYRVPPDACASYRGCMQALEAFEQELRAHADVETNVLAAKLRMFAAPAFA